MSTAKTLGTSDLLERGWTPTAIRDWLLPIQPDAKRRRYLESDALAFERTSEWALWIKGRKAREAAQAIWDAAHAPSASTPSEPTRPTPEPFSAPLRASPSNPDRIPTLAPPPDGSRYPSGRDLAWFHQESDAACGYRAAPLQAQTSRSTDPPDPYEGMLGSIARARSIRVVLTELCQRDQVLLHAYYSVGRKDPNRDLVAYFGHLYPVVHLLMGDELDSLTSALRRARRGRQTHVGDADHVQLIDASRVAERAIESAHNAYNRTKAKVGK